MWIKDDVEEQEDLLDTHMESIEKLKLNNIVFLFNGLNEIQNTSLLLYIKKSGDMNNFLLTDFIAYLTTRSIDFQLKFEWEKLDFDTVMETMLEIQKEYNIVADIKLTFKDKLYFYYRNILKNLKYYKFYITLKLISKSSKYLEPK